MSDHPLTKAQLGVYLECVKHPESTQYNNPFSMLLDPQLDPDRIEKAILNIYDVRKELHLHFTEDADGSPCQYISKRRRIPICTEVFADRFCLMVMSLCSEPRSLPRTKTDIFSLIFIISSLTVPPCSHCFRTGTLRMHTRKTG